jgi:diguanylate cyclase (GGDEF)-like protein
MELDTRLQYNKSIITNNIKRIFIIGCLYTLFEMFGLTLSTLGFFQSDIRGYVFVVVVFHLIYLPTLYIASFVKKNTPTRVLDVLQCLYFPVLAAWACVFTALIYLQAQDITIYAIVMMLFAAMFIIRPTRGKILFGGSFVFFAVLIYMNAETILIANALTFKSLIVTVLAYVISLTNYNIRLDLYNKNKMLSENNQLLKNQVIRDSLTGLYNNGFIFKYLDQMINDQPGDLALIMLDIDDFKNVNDQYGHLQGDIVIQNIATLLLDLSHEDEVTARYGGEEFIIVLEDKDGKRAFELANNILEAVRKLKFTFGEGVTVSIGISHYDNDNRETQIKKADDQLYRAKNDGKNKIYA